MDPESQALLDEILAKDISAITESDIVFLKARISYLTEEQLEKYKDFLEIKPEISYQDLMAKAKELGLKVRVGLKRQQVEQMIAEVK